MKRTKRILFMALTGLLICFIWGQSMLPQKTSAAESSRLMNLIKPLLDPGDRIDGETFHHYIRKAAHFSEYAALGFCMSGFFRNLVWKRKPLHIPAAVAGCAFVAAVDESIQLFTDGRGARVSDVLLDISGAVFGLAVLSLLIILFHKRNAA